MIRRLDTTAADFDRLLDALLSYESAESEEIDALVRQIINTVRRHGDAALVEYTNRYDHREVKSVAELELTPADLSHALEGIDQELRAALERAAERIDAYHRHQGLESWTYTEADGTRLGQRVTPMERIGVYVPGGKAAYPSSVLMNVIPARVAGVREVLMVVPAPGGLLAPAVLAAAAIAGVDRVFSIGGAQAIAALAYGTDRIPRVDKIVGPGNVYVARAKSMVYGAVGIDMIAGPSEILIICDGSAPAEWVVMDLFSQAEHDEQAQAVLLCPDAGYLDEVAECLERELSGMDRADVIAAALSRRGALIRVRDLAEAVDVANRIAPEHLQLSVADPDSLLPRVRHAGAIFMGCYTAEVLGDYCAGPNHVLPTGGTARFSSPLSVYDFQKRTSLIMSSVSAASRMGRTASVIARAEGLTAHARAAECRITRSAGSGDDGAGEGRE